MASDLLYGARLKIKWGGEAVQSIASELQSALSGDRLEVFEEVDAVTQDRLLKIKLRGPLPSEVQKQIGIAAHMLRSSLDATAIALAKTAKLASLDHVYFPLGKDKDTFEKQSQAKLRGIDAVAVKIIEGFKPYQGGNNLLWGLHRLSIADKHYDIIPMLGAGNINLIQDLHIKNAKVGIIYGGGRLDEGFAISNLGTHGTFEGRGNLPPGAANIGVQCDAFFGQDIEIFAGQSIHGILVNAERLVTEIVDALERHCA
jgi:hypothetical protein